MPEQKDLEWDIQLAECSPSFIFLFALGGGGGGYRKDGQVCIKCSSSINQH